MFWHVIAWTIFIFTEFAMALMVEAPEAWWSFLVFSIPELFLFYGHYYLIQNTLGKNRSMMQVGLLLLGMLLLASVFCTVVISMRILLNNILHNEAPLYPNSLYIGSALFRYFILSILGTAYWLLTNYIKQLKAISHLQIQAAEEQLKIVLLERDSAKNHNAWLKARLKPHLIFNTLSFVQSKVVEDEQAMQSIRLLTNLLRHSMEEPEADGLVSIDKEWDVVRDYVSLHQMRYERPIFVLLQLKNEYPEQSMPTLVLLSLLENIFKHGEIFKEDKPALFQLQTEEHGWSLMISNSHRLSKASLEKSGIGIRGIEARLRSTYGPDGYKLFVTDTESTYKLHIIVHSKHVTS